MIWIVFASAGAAFRYGNHVAIEMVVDLMPKKIQKACTVFISVVVVAVISYLFIQSIGFIQLFIKSGRSTPMLGIPYKYIYGIAPVSFILMILNYFYALFKGVKSEAKEAVDSE
jgi:TRAP-type C4-dicarboxylate transport system permease small subunit